MVRLLIRASAEKDLRGLPASLFQRVNARILALREEPRPAGSLKLSGNLEGWRVRLGDYRILYQIDDAAQTLTIVRIKHRREVYH